jgi:hypothetical protein
MAINDGFAPAAIAVPTFGVPPDSVMGVTVLSEKFATSAVFPFEVSAMPHGLLPTAIGVPAVPLGKLIGRT